MARITTVLPKSRRGRGARDLDSDVLNEAANLNSPDDGAVTDGVVYETKTRATSAAAAYRTNLKEKRGKSISARVIEVDKDEQPILSASDGFHYVDANGDEAEKVPAGKLNDGAPAGYIFALVASNGGN